MGHKKSVIIDDKYFNDAAQWQHSRTKYWLVGTIKPPYRNQPTAYPRQPYVLSDRKRPFPIHSSSTRDRHVSFKA